MRYLAPLLAFALCASHVLSSPLTTRAAAADSKVGYLFTSFPVDDEAIYFHLSTDNQVLSGWQPLSLNGSASSQAILRPKVGTGGVRDSFVVRSPNNDRFWLIATDLNVNFYNGDFNIASRNGSRSIVVWESTDLANWSEPRLSPALVDKSAGNVWAPEANWDDGLQAYIVVFASRFFDQTNDPAHKALPIPPNQLMYVTTKDFKTFTPAKRYVDVDYPVIDATFIRNTAKAPNAWVRFIKDERDFTIYQEESTTGLLGSWKPVGGASASARITANSAYHNNEGPLAFEDNVQKGLFHLWIDENTQQRYIPYSASTLEDIKAWKQDSLKDFPQNVKHGSITPLNQKQYDAIKNKYPVVKA
ncbi:hypothetical protein ACQY0O_002344 [Thecaphora frezii]